MILDLSEMDRSQFLNAPPYFDGSNYAFCKVHMCAFLYVVNETMWDSVKNGYIRPTTTKSEWDKAALALANTNSKAIMLFSVVFLLMSFTGFRM